MKRILVFALAIMMLFAMTACGEPTETTTAETTTAETTTAPAAPVTPSVNEGELKAGVYTGSAFYEGMGVTWNFVLTLKEDGTFTLTNDAGEAKGEGTYALTDDCYTLTYSDERTGSFVVQKDGKLKLTSDFPFGMVKIQLALVGDILFTYQGEAPAESGSTEEEPDTEAYTLEAGIYVATYERVTGMGNTVNYEYVITVGEDGSFAYAVTYPMGDALMQGLSATGTYVLDGNKLTFTDTEGNVTEGKLTADNAITISLRATQMSQNLYEITATPKIYTLEAGTYGTIYEKVSPMAGTVAYTYVATVGENGTFSYFVQFKMGDTTMEGSRAEGTYTLEGNTFTFTDSEGNVTVGTLTNNNAITISLKASQMAKDPYEVTLIPATVTYN